MICPQNVDRLEGAGLLEATAAAPLNRFFRSGLQFRLRPRTKTFRHDRNHTGVKIAKALSRYYRMQIVDYKEFTRSHADFLLYAEPEGWILTALCHEGASAQVLKIAGSRWIYRVTMNGGAGALRKTSLPGSGNE